MKRFIYAILLSAVMPLFLIARLGNTVDNARPYQSAKSYPVQIDVKNAPSFENLNNFKKDDVSKLLGNSKYAMIIPNVDAGWNAYGDFTPFQYEPISNTLAIVLSRYGRTATYDQDSLLISYVNYYYSQDYGSTWNSIVLDSSNNVFVNTSFGLINPGNETNPLNLNIAVFGPNYTPAKDYRMESHFWLIYEGKTKAKELIAESGPLNFNDKQDYWFGTKMLTSKDKFYAYARLQPKSDDFNNLLSQFGTYGFGRTDVSLNGYYSSIPTKWKYDNFYVEPGNLGSTYNDRMYMDADVDGNLYACFNNILAGAEVTKYQERVPMVSKSTDQGETWSDYDKVPFETIKAFLTQFGGNTEMKNSNFSTIPYVRNYSQSAFVVTGPDQYSFFYRLLIVKAPDTIDVLLAEAMKTPGQPWKMIPIAFVNGIVSALSDTASAAIPEDIFESSDNENELQVTKTVDGQNLVIKWLDFALLDPNNGKYVSWDTTAYLCTKLGYNPGMRIDSMWTTDVFMAHKGINEDTWSEPVNATNDKWFNKITFIPPVIKDLNNIPIFEHIVREFKAANYTQTNKNYIRANAPYNYPYQLQNRIMERNVPQNIIYGVFDINNPVALANPILMPDKGAGNSVEEFANPDFSVNSIKPNPGRS